MHHTQIVGQKVSRSVFVPEDFYLSQYLSLLFIQWLNQADFSGDAVDTTFSPSPHAATASAPRTRWPAAGLGICARSFEWPG